jgi:hypothetical protein
MLDGADLAKAVAAHPGDVEAVLSSNTHSNPMPSRSCERS